MPDEGCRRPAAEMASRVPRVQLTEGDAGLITFMSTRGAVLRPGEREAVIEERHYIGKHDDHRNYRS